MPLTPEDDLTLALDTVAVVNDYLPIIGNIQGDQYAVQNKDGTFAGSVNVWSAFREALDEIGGSQGLDELGLI